MKNQSRLLKLFALALLAFGFAVAKDWSDVSAHDGHKHKRAPASKRKQPKARPADSGDKVEKPSGDSLTISMKRNLAGPGSISPNFTRTPDGGVLLSWLEPAGDQGFALRFAIRRGDNWTAPRTITTRRNFMKHPAELPIVTMLSDNNFVALWTQGKGESDEGEDAYACASRDGGKTWSTPARTHRDDSAAEHGLVSMTPAGADAATIIWLDGGNGKTTELKQATLKADGSVSGEVSLDDDVCACCPTSILNTPDGSLLAYRDRTPDDIRDISFVRFREGKWSAPQSLHQDGWRINGCPTNSVQLAAEGKRVTAAWFTAANNQGKVKVAFSNDGGGTFGAPLQVNEAMALGRASVALLPDGSALVAWAEKAPNASRILVRRINADGKLSGVTAVATGTKAFPRLERASEQMMIVWSDKASVRTALISPGSAGQQASNK